MHVNNLTARISDHAVTRLLHNFHVVEANLWSFITEGPFRAVVSMRQISHFPFSFFLLFFLNGEIKTVLNTQEEDLTMDIAPIIIFSGQLGLSLTSQWYISNVRT